MIAKKSPFIHFGRVAARHTALLVLFCLAAWSSARASTLSVEPNTVIPFDQFGIEVIGYNTTTAPSGNIFVIAPNLMPAFGSTQSYPGGALGGQTLTVTSSESRNGNIFTDTISISVPTNFVPAGTVDNNGNLINALDFSIGSIANTSGTNPLDFTTPISLLSVTGSVTFSGISIGLTQNPVLTNGNTSFSNQEAVQSASNTTPISSSNVTGFSMTITYSVVPEPSTAGAVLLGAGGLIGLTMLRRRRSAA